MLLTRYFVLATLLFTATCARPAELLKSGDFSDLTAWQRGGAPDKVTYSPGEAATGPGAPTGPGIHIAVTPAPGDSAWSITLSQRNQESVGQGDGLTLTFWARSQQSLTIAAYVEENQDPYPKIMSTGEVNLTPDWHQFTFTGKTSRAYDTNQLNLTFHLARGTGDIDLDDISLQNTPSTTAPYVSNASLDHPVTLVANGDFTGPLAGWSFNGGEKIAHEVIDNAAGKALRLHVAPAPGASPYSVTAYHRFELPVNAGEVVRLIVSLRSPDNVRAGLVFEESSEPYSKPVTRLVRATPEWAEYRMHFRAERNYGAGEMQLTLHLGRDSGALELANVRVEDLGTLTSAQYVALGPATDYFGGEPNDDSWRAPALARIEKYRKADLQVQVVDANGKPLPDATVHIQMKRHAFHFGMVVNPYVLLNPDADGDKYREILARDYNTAVFEGTMKWYGFEKNPVLAASQNQQCLAWLQAHNFNVRGHCLVWGGKNLCPPRLFTEDIPTARQDVHDHIATFMKRYQGQVYIWDVVNESVTQGALWDRIGWDAFPEAYRTAHETDPNVQLSYNDYNISNELPDSGVQLQKVKAKIQALIDANAPLDVIGDQGHMGVPLTPVKDVVGIWDDIAKYGKKMEVTEFDLGVTDDTVQAQYLTDYLTAAFAQPQMQSFVFWGFWEKAHWRAKDGAALYSKDWIPRPAQLAYEKLVFKDWWTDATLQTGADGTAQTRGFLGDYDITVTQNGQSQTISKSLTSDGLKLQVTVANH